MPEYTVWETTNLDPGLKREPLATFNSYQEAEDYLDHYLINTFGSLENDFGEERPDPDSIPPYMEYDIWPSS